MSLPNPTPPSAGQFAHGHGLGVIWMGAELPLRSLCSLPESVAATVGTVLSGLENGRRSNPVQLI